MEVGRPTYGHEQITMHHWGDPTELRIGAFCSIADRVHVFLGRNHRSDWVTSYPFPAFPEKWPVAKGIEGIPVSNGDVVVGNHVWIGSNATIMSGVTIADGAVIGTDSCVTRDVAPYAIVVGNPRAGDPPAFDEETIAKLLEWRWWDWSGERIGANAALLSSTDIGRFIQEQYGPPSRQRRWRRLLGSRR